MFVKLPNCLVNMQQCMSVHLVLNDGKTSTAFVTVAARHFIDGNHLAAVEEALINEWLFLDLAAAAAKRKLPPWTAANQKAALRDGWGVFEQAGRQVIQRHDEAGRFSGDLAARTHVQQRASIEGKRSIYARALARTA